MEKFYFIHVTRFETILAAESILRVFEFSLRRIKHVRKDSWADMLQPINHCTSSCWVQ